MYPMFYLLKGDYNRKRAQSPALNFKAPGSKFPKQIEGSIKLQYFKALLERTPNLGGLHGSLEES